MIALTVQFNIILYHQRNLLRFLAFSLCCLNVLEIAAWEREGEIERSQSTPMLLRTAGLPADKTSL